MSACRREVARHPQDTTSDNYLLSNFCFKEKNEEKSMEQQNKERLALLPPSSPIQRARRRGFYLLDRLMRQASRGKGPGQQGVTEGPEFVLTLSGYTNLINWTREQFVYLGVWRRARMHAGFFPVLIFICRQRGRFAETGWLVSLLQLERLKGTYVGEENHIDGVKSCRY